MTEIESAIIARLDAILAKLAPGGGVQPPDVPELTAAQIDPATMDGVTIQRDGSTWTLDATRGNAPLGLIYGYISPAKDAALWGRMVAVMGDEARLTAILAGNGPLARYKLHPAAVVHQGGNSFFLLSHLLSNPLPPASPTV